MLELVNMMLVFFGFARLISAGQVWKRAERPSAARSPITAWLVVYGGAAAVFVLSFLSIGVVQATVIAGGTLIPLTVRRRFSDLHTEGFLSMSTAVLSGVALLTWLSCLVVAAEVDFLARICLWTLVIAMMATVPVHLVGDYLDQEVLCRNRWSRPRLRRDPALPAVKISVHVPCYAEPPDVVIATLDALARQRYENFEVIVIDNNTK